MTYEEFVQHAQTFACDNREPGTLSLRHLQRLASGRSLGTLRPATARLLEHLLDEPIAALLAPPKTGADEGENPLGLKRS
jgi:ABC-type molybdate transport system ATPase subunit